MRAFLAALIATTVAGTAAAQPKPEATVHRLRNISAEDAAKAVSAFAEQTKLPVAVVAEPVSNSVMVAGAADAIKRAGELLKKLDTPPPMVLVQALILEAPAGFAEGVGLEAGEKWTLTAREARMLSIGIREAKARDGVDILSRPQIMVQNNQTGIVQVGGQTATITPRLSPNGILLRAEARTTTTGACTRSIQTTEAIPDGGTLVFRGGRTKTATGDAREILIVLTPHRVMHEK